MSARGTRPLRYSPTPVPATVDPVLADYLRRELASLAHALTTAHDLDVTAQAPERAAAGMLRYADGTAWNPGAGKGVYVFDGVQWVKR